MFDVSFSELMVIGVVALIVIGPERLPRVARTAGHLLGRLQRYVNNVKADINREMHLEDLRKFEQEVKSQMQSVETSVRSELNSVQTDVSKVQDDLTTQTIAPPSTEIPIPHAGHPIAPATEGSPLGTPTSAAPEASRGHG